MKPAAGPATAPAETAADMWSDSLAKYRNIAAGVLTSHHRVDYACKDCGQPWPCQAVCAAEFVLEL